MNATPLNANLANASISWSAFISLLKLFELNLFQSETFRQTSKLKSWSERTNIGQNELSEKLQFNQWLLITSYNY